MRSGRHDRFRDRYGPWAVVAGASAGLGAAFADALARRGLHLVLIARRGTMLTNLATRLEETHGIEVRTLTYDLSNTAFPSAFAEVVADLDVGLGVYNAASSTLGAFLDSPLSELHEAADVNVKAPITFARTLAPSMASRGRGGLVLMSSLAGLQGSPRIATYAGTKAFTNVFAEGLWHELRGRGVDVHACCVGAVRTPGFAEVSKKDPPGTLDPERVAEAALNALGRGPVVVPGLVNRIVGLVVGRWLPRRVSIRIMAANTKDLG